MGADIINGSISSFSEIIPDIRDEYKIVSDSLQTNKSVKNCPEVTICFLFVFISSFEIGSRKILNLFCFL